MGRIEGRGDSIMGVDMRCLLNRVEGCYFERCRYWKKNACVLEDLHWSAWPSKDERLKKDEYKETSMMAKGDKTGE